MIEVFLRGPADDVKCAKCHEQMWYLSVDGLALCKGCLASAVHGAVNPTGAGAYELRQLENEITRLTGHSVRGLKSLPREVIEDLRRAVRSVEQTKQSVSSKLRRYGLPGV